MQQNRFTDIPSEILLSLPFLRSLNLNYNRLTKFSDAICECTNLRRLNIVGNKIEELPNSISKLTLLNYFSISSNKVKELPAELSKLTSLQVLCISRNLLQDIDIIGKILIFLTNVASLTTLRGLDISHNKILKVPEWLSSLTALEVFIGDQKNKFLGSKELYEHFVRN